MSAFSTNLGIELITTGTQAGVWGDTTNTNLGTLIEQAISGYVTYAVTGGTDTITIPDGATGVARNMFLELTGTGGGTLVVPAKRKLYFIYNNTGAGAAVTVKVSGQTGVSVPDGKKMLLVNNGTDVVNATNHMATLTLGSALPVTSGGTGTTTSTGSGNVVLSTSPTLVTPALGTPASGVLTNCTGTASGLTAGNATNLSTGSFSVVESGGKLVFKYGTTAIASMDSSGNFISLANVTAYGTP